MQLDNKIAQANCHLQTFKFMLRHFEACELYQVTTLNLVKNLQIPGKKKKKRHLWAQFIRSSVCHIQMF